MNNPRTQSRSRDAKSIGNADRLADALLQLEESQPHLTTSGALPAHRACGPQASKGDSETDARDAAHFSLDRRRFPRYESIGRVAVFRLANAESADENTVQWQLHAGRIDGSLIDISLNGVAFVLHTPVEIGEQLLVRMTSRTFGCSVDQSAKVIRTKTLEPGQWEVICQFNHNLPVEQVRILGRQLSQLKAGQLI